jgi:hypothetical protein
MWPDSTDSARRVKVAFAHPASVNTVFTAGAPAVDATGNSVNTSEAPVSLAFWGTAAGTSLATNQTWMAAIDRDNKVRVYRYDGGSDRWIDLTTTVFAEVPQQKAMERIGFCLNLRAMRTAALPTSLVIEIAGGAP